MLKKKKDGGVSLKEALFKAAKNNSDTEMSNLGTKTNKITEILKKNGVDQEVEDLTVNNKQGVYADGIYLEETDPL